MPKPKISMVIVPKTKITMVIDTKPKMVNTMQPVEQEQQYSITITAGMYMPLPILTYPTDQTFSSPIQR